jgi:WD40 repeat protein
MGSFYNTGGTSWKEYLQQQSFVDEITTGIRRSGEAAVSATRDAINEQTRSMIASNDALASQYAEGFDRISFGLNEIKDGILGLRADFNWTMAGLMHKLDVQNLMLKDIYAELRIPDFQKERRYYVEQACKHYQNGLYKESLENFLLAEPLEKTDPFVHFSLGQIYLYQAVLLNLEKAQNSFALAGKYYFSEKNNKKAGESYLHAGIAAYLRKDSVNAPLFAQKSFELYPELLEAFYNHAKFLAAQGSDAGLQSLEIAIRQDRNYILKAGADGDFKRISEQLSGLIEKLIIETKNETKNIISELEQKLNFYILRDNKIAIEISESTKHARAAFANDAPYFECLDFLSKFKRILNSIHNNIQKEGIIGLNEYLTINSKDPSCDAFSPDGLFLATNPDYNTTTIIELTKKNEKFKLPGRILAFSPDGSYLACISHENWTVELWDVKNGKMLYSLPGNQMAFSPDWLTMAISHDFGEGIIQRTDIDKKKTENRNQEVNLFKVKTGEAVNINLDNSGPVNHMKFLPDGLYLAGIERISTKNRFKLWDLKTGKEIYSLSAYENNFAFSPDGVFLVLITDYGTLTVYDLKTGKEIYSLRVMKDKFAFSPDGLLLALMADYNGTLTVIDMKTGKEVYSRELRGEFITKYSKFSPDGLLLAYLKPEPGYELAVCDAKTGKEIYSLACQSSIFTDIAFSPDGLFLAGLSSGNSWSYNTINIWDVMTGKKLVETSCCNRLSDISFSPDGSFIAGYSISPGTVNLWKIEYDYLTKAELSKREENKRKAGEEEKRKAEAERIRAKEKAQQSQWRSEGKCEICGEKLPFLKKIIGNKRCEKHR